MKKLSIGICGIATATIIVLLFFEIMLLIKKKTEETYTDKPARIFLISEADLNKYKNVLIDSDSLSDSHVDYEDNISEYAFALSMLFNSNLSLNDKRTLFYSIFNESHHVYGKLYALAALHSIDESLYLSLQQELKMGQIVTFFSGDTKEDCTISTILDRITNLNLIHFMLLIDSKTLTVNNSIKMVKPSQALPSSSPAPQAGENDGETINPKQTQDKIQIPKK